MKKSILTMTMLSSMIALSANQYITVINNNDNNYKITLADNSYNEYDSWTVVEKSNCSYENDWLESDVYKDTHYTKTTTCDEKQERNVYNYSYNESGTPILNSTTKETQTLLNVARQENLVGTKESRNCLEILNSHGSIGDGNYTLYVNSSTFSSYCDMTNGGWTLAMRLKNSGQLNGSGRDNFWNSGGQLSSSYAYTPFSVGFGINELGFLGWDRIKGMLNSNDLTIAVRGVNVLGNSVNTEYTLQNFNPIMSDSTIDTGTLSGGGVYTIAKRGDTNTRNGWGVCGTGSYSDAHIGLGLCPNGYNSNGPEGDEVQIWHYGSHYTAYNHSMNVSFGEADQTGVTTSYNNSKTLELMLFIK